MAKICERPAVNLARLWACLWLVLSVLPTAGWAGQIALEWDRNDELLVVGYRLYYGAPVGQFNSSVDCRDATTIVVTNLHAGRHYGFQVTAYNALGVESDPSNLFDFQVPGVDARPVALSAALVLQEGDVKELKLAGGDSDRDPLTFQITSPPLHGTLSGKPPNIIYRAPIGYTGSDLFSFVTRDGYQTSEVAEISVKVQPAMNAVYIDLAHISANRWGEFGLPATNPDGIPLTYSLVTPPQHGRIAGVFPTIEYQPAVDYSGTDDFVLKMTANPPNDFTILLVRIAIDPVIGSPVSGDQQIVVTSGLASPIQLGAAGLDALALTFEIGDPPAHGTLTGIPPKLTYTSQSDFVGIDAFTFRFSDFSNDTNEPTTATVTLQVRALNLIPWVDAGPNQTITLPGRAFLRGRVQDDHQPLPEHVLEVSWSQISGPGPANFDPFSVTTLASFPTNGTYLFALRAFDGELSSTETVGIEVHRLEPSPTNSLPFAKYFEARFGELTEPMEIFTNSIPDPVAPKWVATTVTNSGVDLMSFEVPVDGNYLFWCRIQTRGSTHHSFFASIDTLSSTEDIVDIPDEENTEEWKWILLSGRGGIFFGETFANTINPRVFSLTAGRHSIAIRGGTLDTRIDSLVVTSDPLFDPRQVEAITELPTVAIGPAAAGGLELQWSSVPGRRYIAISKANLFERQWIPIGDAFRATSIRSSQSIPESTANETQFYSVVSLP